MEIIAPKDFSPFFIVGAPRSGTTLLTVLLDRHSQICVPPETHFFHTLPREWFLKRNLSHNKLIEECVYGNHIYDFHLDRSAITDHFSKMEPTYPNVFMAALQVYADLRGKKIIGEKTATHMDDIATILKWYPMAKIIWILRDGRDVAMGLMRHQHLHSRIRRHCFTWRRLTRLGHFWKKKLPSDQFYNIRFEDLVTQPKEEMNKLCQFLGVGFEENILDTNQESGAVLEKEVEHKGRALGKIDSSRIGVWNNSATQEQKDIMLSVIGKELVRSGYDISSMKSSSPLSSSAQSLRNIPYSVLYNKNVYNSLKVGQHYLYKLGLRFNSFYKAQQG